MLEEDFPSQSYREVSHETGNKVSAVRSMPVALTYRGDLCAAAAPRRERNQRRYFRVPFPDRSPDVFPSDDCQVATRIAPEDAFLRDRRAPSRIHERKRPEGAMSSALPTGILFLFPRRSGLRSAVYTANSFQIYYLLCCIKKKQSLKQNVIKANFSNVKRFPTLRNQSGKLLGFYL